MKPKKIYKILKNFYYILFYILYNKTKYEKIIFLNIFFPFKENDFLMFECIMKNLKENQIYIKLFRNLSILKLFNLYSAR